MVYFYASGNQLTGSIPDLSMCIDLQYFYCDRNQLTGAIPDLSLCVNLRYFICDQNQLIGSIPNLNTCINLQWFDCYNNELTSCGIFTMPTTLAHFYAYNNLFTQPAIDQILANFDSNLAARPVVGTIDLSGTGNAAPGPAGIIYKNNIIAHGWTVTTN